MNRSIVENLLSKYIAALEAAIDSVEATPARASYHMHAKVAESILARWRGGESQANVKADLATELQLYARETLPGQEAELVGEAFGDVYRYLDKANRTAS